MVALTALILAFLFFRKRKKEEEQKEILKEPIKIYDKINTLMRSSTQQYSTRDLSKINKIILHHSAATGQTAEDYARYHVQSNGWPGIGYHFVIEKNGDIIQGNSLETVSYHAAGKNTESIGISLSGNFMNEQPTAAQIKSLKQLVAHLRAQLNKNLPVSGHRDHGQTSCPGTNLYPIISQL